MPQSTHGLHHFHKRKRVFQKHEKYPSINKQKRILDSLIYIIVFLGPVVTLPQIVNIWVEKNASGVSAVSWGSYSMISVFWLLYGIAHKEKPIIVSSCIWIVIHSIIATGAILYG